MYREVTYEQLRTLVQSQGHVIEWCGAKTQNFVVVHTRLDNVRHKYKLRATSLFDSIKFTGTVRNGEADVPETVVGPVPPNADFSAVLRKASALGINIAGPCVSGSANKYVAVEGCVCGYDLEIDLSKTVKGGFPLPSVPILSSALWCTCGFRLFLTSMQCNEPDSTGSLSSTEIASMTIDAVATHSPLWLVGWNCYSFDNSFLYYHAPSAYHDMFNLVKVGDASSVDYGYIINVIGTYNVDGYGYLQRNPGHSYPDLSLAGVATKLGAMEKTEMPDLFGGSNSKEIMEYNMNDSAVAADVWIKSGACFEVPSLAVSSCSPVYDCVRYMTGAMAACATSSEAIHRGLLIDWSRSTRTVRYEGGMVLDPLKGLHRNVVIVDFSSMYPTIMVDARISSEAIIITESATRPYGDVWWDDESIYVSLENCTAQYPREGSSIQRDILLKMIARRNENRRSNPKYAGTLKVTGNSFYGANGYENSPMYSPACSSSVTAIGRWCLNLACKVFERCGLRVVYGDTDSCLLVPTSVTTAQHNDDVKKHVNAALDVLHAELSRTPFTSMRMSFESYHPSVILIEKKKYCLGSSDGTIKFKGVSVARRDAIGICKHACRTVAGIIMESHDKTAATNSIARYICSVVAVALEESFSASDVSMVKKRDQKRCYVYKGPDGKERTAPMDTSENAISDYGTSYVLQAFRAEVLRLTVPCGLGSLQEIMSSSNAWV